MGHGQIDVINPDDPHDVGDIIRIKAKPVTLVLSDETEIDAEEKPQITIFDPDGNKEVDAATMSKEADGHFFYEWDTDTNISYSVTDGYVEDFEVEIVAEEKGGKEVDRRYLRLRN